MASGSARHMASRAVPSSPKVARRIVTRSAPGNLWIGRPFQALVWDGDLGGIGWARPRRTGPACRPRPAYGPSQEAPLSRLAPSAHPAGSAGRCEGPHQSGGPMVLLGSSRIRRTGGRSEPLRSGPGQPSHNIGTPRWVANRSRTCVRACVRARVRARACVRACVRVRARCVRACGCVRALGSGLARWPT